MTWREAHPYQPLSDRHPFEVYLLVWASVTSLPAALGLTPVSIVLREQAGQGVGRIWSCALALGCLIALLGLGWRRPVRGCLSVTGLTLEQIGLITVAGSTIFYSAAALLRSGFSSLAVVGVILGVGTASIAQAWKIQRVLKALQ